MIRRVIVKDFSAQAAKGEGQRMKVPKGRYSIKGHDFPFFLSFVKKKYQDLGLVILNCICFAACG